MLPCFCYFHQLKKDIFQMTFRVYEDSLFNISNLIFEDCTMKDNFQYWKQLWKTSIFEDINFWRLDFVEQSTFKVFNFWRNQLLKTSISEAINFSRPQFLKKSTFEDFNFWWNKLWKTVISEETNFWRLSIWSLKNFFFFKGSHFHAFAILIILTKTIFFPMTMRNYEESPFNISNLIF